VPYGPHFPCRLDLQEVHPTTYAQLFIEVWVPHKDLITYH